MNAQRWSLGMTAMRQDNQGDWVAYTDYAEAQKTIETQRGIVDQALKFDMAEQDLIQQARDIIIWHLKRNIVKDQEDQ